MFFHHFREVTAHTKLGNITVIETDIDCSVIVCFHDEIGNDLLEVSPDSFSQRGTGTRVQLGDFADNFIERIFVDIQFPDDFLPMLAGEFFIIVSDNTFFEFQYRVGGPFFTLLPADL